jgi:hypothetical protein
MPGKGAFVLAVWLAAFVALVVAPGWPGFIALMAGVTISAVLLDLSDGVFGLVFLIVAVVSALAAHGALSAAVLMRLRTLGWRKGVQEERILSGGWSGGWARADLRLVRQRARAKPAVGCQQGEGAWDTRVGAGFCQASSGY